MIAVASMVPIMMRFRSILCPSQLIRTNDRASAPVVAETATAYPADKYGLVLWDHGAGWPGVGPDETDVKSGRISIESPVARALLGRKEGDEVVVERPRGRAGYTIVRIAYA